MVEYKREVERQERKERGRTSGPWQSELSVGSMRADSLL